MTDATAEIARRRTRSDWMGIERERGISAPPFGAVSGVA